MAKIRKLIVSTIYRVTKYKSKLSVCSQYVYIYLFVWHLLKNNHLCLEASPACGYKCDHINSNNPVTLLLTISRLFRRSAALGEQDRFFLFLFHTIPPYRGPAQRDPFRTFILKKKATLYAHSILCRGHHPSQKVILWVFLWTLING